MHEPAGTPAARVATSAGATVREFSAADAERWDRYVHGRPQATFFHLSGWKQVLERSFGQQAHYLLAESAGAIVGVLPLSRQQSPLFGDALVSTPFCVYGGAVADDERTAMMLEDAAVSLGEQLGVDHVELRNLVSRRADWVHVDRFCTFRRGIEDDPVKNLLAIPRKQRAEVRKGEKRQLTLSLEHDPDRCWRLYAASVHRHGTPVYARRYFRDLKDVFGASCEFLTVQDHGRPVAGLLNFYFRDEVLPYYAGSASGGRDGEIHPWMYWSLMNHAAAKGARTFDFGRSMRGSGTFAFKQNFGFEPTPLHYEIRLVRGKAAPEMDPHSPRYRLVIEVWKRLPEPIVNAVGPWLSRQLG